jgi:hypothetical protein
LSSTIAKPGRPLTLCEDLERAVLKGIGAGKTGLDAALAAGVPRSTFFEWLQRARGDHPSRAPTEALCDFAAAITAAVRAGRV